MEVSKEDAEIYFNSERNLANRFRSDKVELEESNANIPSLVPEIIEHRQDYSKCGKHLSKESRAQVAVLAHAAIATQAEIASVFDVSVDTVQETKKALQDSPEVVEFQSRANIVRDFALDKLMESLNLIDADKLKKCKASELAHMAKNFSAITKDLIPAEQVKKEGNEVTLHIYVPQIRKEEAFNVVEV